MRLLNCVYWFRIRRLVARRFEDEDVEEEAGSTLGQFGTPRADARPVGDDEEAAQKVVDRRRRSRWVGGGGRPSSIPTCLGYGRPAELFRTDFITAMKVNENDTSLDKEDWWVVSDPWRQDWNKGVQIPVDPSSIPQAECRPLPNQQRVQLSSTFKQYVVDAVDEKRID